MHGVFEIQNEILQNRVTSIFEVATQLLLLQFYKFLVTTPRAREILL